jgi:uncharacterized repeat protein (TIGR01451 family)
VVDDLPPGVYQLTPTVPSGFTISPLAENVLDPSTGSTGNIDTRNGPVATPHLGIAPPVDLAIVKTASNEVVNLGDQLTWHLKVTNAGRRTVEEATVVDTLPASLQYVSVAGSDFTCAADGQVVTCHRATKMVAGDVSGIDIVTKVVDGSAEIINSARVKSDRPNAVDVVATNNNSSAPVSVGGISRKAPTPIDTALAFTGSNAGLMLAVAFMLLGGGTVILVAKRRRQKQS